MSPQKEYASARCGDQRCAVRPAAPPAPSAINSTTSSHRRWVVFSLSRAARSADVRSGTACGEGPAGAGGGIGRRRGGAGGLAIGAGGRAGGGGGGMGAGGAACEMLVGGSGGSLGAGGRGGGGGAGGAGVGGAGRVGGSVVGGSVVGGSVVGGSVVGGSVVGGSVVGGFVVGGFVVGGSVVGGSVVEGDVGGSMEVGGQGGRCGGPCPGFVRWDEGSLDVGEPARAAGATAEPVAVEATGTDNASSTTAKTSPGITKPGGVLARRDGLIFIMTVR